MKTTITLITPETIHELLILGSLPLVVKQLINATLLSKRFNHATKINDPRFASTHWHHQTTASALYRSIKYEIPDVGGINQMKKILNKLSDVAPELFRYSQSKDGEQVLPIITNHNNKVDVEKYYQFPLVVGSVNPDYPVFKDGQGFEDWQIGRRFIAISTDEYHDMLTDNDYFDHQAIIDTDWTETLKKRPVGRPKLKKAPFPKKTERKTNRELLLELLERVKTIEIKLNQ